MEKNEIMELVTEDAGQLVGGIRRAGERYRREVFCSTKSAVRDEFYQAARSGMKASIILVVDRDEFEEASLSRDGRKIRPKEAFYDGMPYRILRTYQVPGSSDLELTCGEIEGVGP